MQPKWIPSCSGTWREQTSGSKARIHLLGGLRAAARKGESRAAACGIYGTNSTSLLGTKGTNKSRDFPTNVRVLPVDSRLPLETVFQAFDVTAVDPAKIDNTPIGQLSAGALSKLQDALRLTLGLQEAQ